MINVNLTIDASDGSFKHKFKNLSITIEELNDIVAAATSQEKLAKEKKKNERKNTRSSKTDLQ